MEYFETVRERDSSPINCCLKKKNKSDFLVLTTDLVVLGAVSVNSVNNDIHLVIGKKVLSIFIHYPIIGIIYINNIIQREIEVVGHFSMYHS